MNAKCFPTDEVVTPAEAFDIEAKNEEDAEVVEKKKVGKPKKVVEEEFADLKVKK